MRSSRQRAAAAVDTAPPQLYLLVSAVFHYLGPAFAVLLFVRIEVLGVAWLRIVAAAVVFAAWRRPWRAWGPLELDGRRLLIAWGTVLAVMNACFYTATTASRSGPWPRSSSCRSSCSPRSALAPGATPWPSRWQCPGCTC